MKENDVKIDAKSKLGRGSFGVVLKGTWKATPVAFKVMDPKGEHSRSSLLRERITFGKEANLLYKLQHRNIVKVD